MLIDIERLRYSERKYILSQFTLVELFQELHRRVDNEDDDEGEIDWEEEMSEIHYRRLAKQFPHFFDKREGR